MTNQEIILNLISLPKHIRNQILAVVDDNLLATGMEKKVFMFLKTNKEANTQDDTKTLHNLVLDFIKIEDEKDYQRWKNIEVYLSDGELVINQLRNQFVKLATNEKLDKLITKWENTKTPEDVLVQMNSALKDVLKSGLIDNNQNNVVQFDANMDFNSIFERIREDNSNRMVSDLIIDKLTFGGFRAKTLNVLIAGTNVGKTFTMLNLAKQYYIKNKNVLYISLEMSTVELSKRTISSFIKKKERNLNESDIPDIKETLKNVTGKLIYVEVPAGRCTTFEVRRIIETKELELGCEFNVVLIDYLQLIRPVSSGGEKRHDLLLNDICVELRSIATEMNLCMISVSQIQRSAQKKGAEVDITNVSDSAGIANTADFVMAIEQLNKDFSCFPNNVFKWSVLKSRYGVKHIYAYCIQDFNSMSCYNINNKIYLGTLEYTDADYARDLSKLDNQTVSFS